MSAVKTPWAGLDTEERGSDVEQKKILGLLRRVTREGGGLDAAKKSETSLTIFGIRVEPPTRTISREYA